MASAKKYILGLLTIIVLSTLISINLSDKVKIDVSKTDTKFYTYNNGWILSGTEILSISGTKYSSSSLSNYRDKKTNFTTISRITKFKDKSQIIDIYYFNGSNSDIELFPIEHTIQVMNASGKLLIYNSTLINPRFNGLNSIIANNNMKIEWNKLSSYKSIDNNNVIIKFNISSNNELFNIRMFDPIIYNASFNTITNIANYSISTEDGTSLDILWNGSNFIVSGSANRKYFVYYENMTYTGINYAYGLTESMQGIEKYNNKYYAIGSTNDLVYEYYSNFTLTGNNWSTATEDGTMTGIFYKSPYFYLIGQDLSKIHLYYENFTYTGINYPYTQSTTGMKDLYYYGSKWYLLGQQAPTKIHVYYDNFTYIDGISYNQDTSMQGFDFHNGLLYANGITNDRVYVYNLTTTIANTITLPSTDGSGIHYRSPINFSITPSISDLNNCWYTIDNGVTNTSVYCQSGNNQIGNLIWKPRYYVSGNYSAFCGQDYVNVSTACGGLATGRWGVAPANISNPGNLYDGDFSTFAENIGATTQDYYFNFTYPQMPGVNMNGTIIEFKLADGNWSNITLTGTASRCLTNTDGNFYGRVRFGTVAAKTSAIHCAHTNGSTYAVVVTKTGTTPIAYGLKMHWNLTYNTTAKDSNPYYNITIYANDSSGNINSTTRNLFIGNTVSYSSRFIDNWFSTSTLVATHRYNNSNIYIGGTSGRFGYINLNNGLIYNQTSNSTLIVGSTGTIYDMCNVSDLLFLETGNINKFGYINLTDNTIVNLTNLTIPYGAAINTIKCYSDLVYFFTSNNIGYYNLSSNTTTNITSAFLSIPDKTIYDVVIDNSLLRMYYVGNNGGFGYYNLSNGVVVNLSNSAIGVSQGSKIDILDDGKVVAAFSSGKLFYYNWSNNIVYDLSATDVGNWIGSVSITGLKAKNNTFYFGAGSTGMSFGYYDFATNVSYDLKYTDDNNPVLLGNNINFFELDNNNNMFLGSSASIFKVFGQPNPQVSNNITTFPTLNNSYSYKINYSINDLTPIDSCWYSRDGGVTNISLNCNGTIPATFIPGDIWNIDIYSNNTYGNLSVASLRNITIVYAYDLSNQDKYNWWGGTASQGLVALGNNIYICPASGKMGKYDIANNYLYDLRAADTNDWIGSSSAVCSQESYSSTLNSIYIYKTTGTNLGLFNVTSETSTNLTFTTQAVNMMAVDKNSENLVYMAAASGNFYRYNYTSNTIIDLSSKDTGDWLSTTAVQSVVFYNQSGTSLFFIGAGAGKLGVYNRTGDVLKQITACNLTSSMNVRALKYIPEKTSIFFTASASMFGYYNVSSGLCYQLNNTGYSSEIISGDDWRSIEYLGDKVYFYSAAVNNIFYEYDFSTNKTKQLNIYTFTSGASSYNSVRYNKDFYVLGTSGAFNKFNISGNMELDILSPAPNNSFTSQNVNLTVLVSGNISMCWYKKNSTDSNNFFTCQNGQPSSFIVSVTPGYQYTFTVFANDTSNNVLNASRTFNALAVENLTSVTSFIGTSGTYSLDYIPGRELIFITADSGKYGYYNITSNRSIDLSTSDTGNWIGSSTVQYSKNLGNFQFIGTASGKFGYYNFSSNTTTNLTSNCGGNCYGTSDTQFIETNGVDEVYISSNIAVLVRLNATTMTPVNKSIPVAFRYMQYDKSRNILYYDGSGGTYGYYNLTSDTAVSWNDTEPGNFFSTTMAGLRYMPSKDIIYFTDTSGRAGYYNWSLGSTQYTSSLQNILFSANSLKLINNSDDMYVCGGSTGLKIGKINITSGLTYDFQSYPLDAGINMNYKDCEYDYTRNVIYTGTSIGNILRFNLTYNIINESTPTPPVTSSCIYSGTGNWNINCTESCNITSNYNLGRNNITISGNGIINWNSTISNFTTFRIIGLNSTNICTVRKRS